MSEKKRGKLLVLGFGPGSEEQMTHRAKEALIESDSIIGYNTYIDIIRPLLTTQEIVRTGMTEEVSRAQEAIRQAETGKKVAVISSGDAGVYGMAGLVYEVLIEKGWKEETGVEVEIIPGVSAINSCASLLGAPVMHDACTISLSDHLTPWELIKKRVKAAAEADFVIALYNPKSGRRTRQIEETQKILLEHRSPNTPVGLVKSAYRERQQIVITDLENMLEHEIGMLTTVVIGNNSTFLYDGKMITPRGYQRKYTLNADDQKLKPHQRLQEEAEPWALHQGQALVEQEEISSVELAEEALTKLGNSYSENKQEVEESDNVFKQDSVFEFSVSPGIANKAFSAKQMLVLGNVVGEKGTIEYTPDHQLKLSVVTADSNTIINQLTEEGLLLHPIGDVVNIKACDFCDGDKKDSIPQVEELQHLLGGISVPKRLNIGFNGCGMACYSAPTNDIGIIFRRGKGFDLFLGAKTTGRNAQVGQLVAEELTAEQIVDIVSRIVEDFRERGLPNERFHKFFKRVQRIEGFTFKEMPEQVLVDMACGD
ncbi:precorrin-3B C(17)-methyltransferase [Bacillus sp. FJAT-45350]|uniref:precorrin-3B C(17)-methyltransferase n=1 Tax=Bacillus sp. FJAT-45350 TaxID=2011014 RepID=UPI000BB86860|nr:precorrin-3B C(17)-methyltransferase [Bacillus sp. FJAT-45350]